MQEKTVKMFLQYPSAPLVTFAIDHYANLTWQESLAIDLCGRKHYTQEKAAEESGYSVDAMQKWYRSGIRKLTIAWSDASWIEKLVEV